MSDNKGWENFPPIGEAYIEPDSRNLIKRAARDVRNFRNRLKAGGLDKYMQELLRSYIADALRFGRSLRTRLTPKTSKAENPS